MDCKEEISDSDSGIILTSGPDSPTSPVKDLSIHTRAMRLKQQALEDRLEMCFLELKKLCVREAELTGKMPYEYPLLQNEKPPQIRRRVGASFKLDEGLLQDGEESVLHALEADLALQRQIYEASRRLSLEEHLSKSVRKSRLQQCKRELKKMKEMQEAVLKQSSKRDCVSPQTRRTSRQRDLSISDDSSLSDVAALDDDFETGPMSPMSPSSGGRLPLLTFTLSPRRCAKQTGSSSSLEYERSPIQNTPWKESSLDQPYQKLQKPSSASSSRSSSPTGTLSDLRLDDIPPAPQFVFKSLAMNNMNCNSVPATPELPLRRHISQSFRIARPKPDVNRPVLDLNRGRTKLPRRRVTDFALAYSVQRLYQCSSDDSSSEHSISSFSSSSSRESTSEATKTLPPPYGYHLTAQNNSQSQHLVQNNCQSQRPVQNSSQSHYPVQNSSQSHYSVQNSSQSHYSVQNSSQRQNTVENNCQSQRPIQNSSQSHHPVQNNSQSQHTVENNSQSQRLLQKNSQIQQTEENNSQSQRLLQKNTQIQHTVENNSQSQRLLQKKTQIQQTDENNSQSQHLLQKNSQIQQTVENNSQSQHLLQKNSQSPLTAFAHSPQNNQTIRKSINRQTVTIHGREKSQERMFSERKREKMNLMSATYKPTNTNKQQQSTVTSPKRMPPPYSSLVRTTSLKEYPSHQGKLFPRDVVTNELKTWHQKNNSTEILQKLQPQEHQRPVKHSQNKEPPAYNKIQSQRETPQKMILQRAADGTPLQWYEKQDREIVSQV